MFAGFNDAAQRDVFACSVYVAFLTYHGATVGYFHAVVTILV